MALAALSCPAVTASPVEALADDNSGTASLQVFRPLTEGEDGHHLAGGGDVEARLTHHAIATTPEPGDDFSEGPVVHVQAAAPAHASGVELDGGPKVQVVVDQRCEEVVGRTHRMDVAGEVEIDVLCRLERGQTSARPSAFDAEDGPERGLAQGGHCVASPTTEAHGQRDRGGGFPLPGRSGGDGGDEHQSTARRTPVEGGQLDFGPMPAPGDDVLHPETQAFCDLVDGTECRHGL